MGIINKVSCRCGFNKKLHLGIGLLSCNVNHIFSLFSDEKIERFKNDIKDEKVGRFFTENIAGFCESCKDIIEVPKINVDLKNGDKYSIIGECSVCDNDVIPLDKEYRCPICDECMNITNEGLWD